MNKAFQVTIKGNDTLVWSNRVEAPTLLQAITMAIEFVDKLTIEQFVEINAKEIN